MKTLQMRLLIAFALLYAAVLAGLGFALGQLFPNYIKNTLQDNAEKLAQDLQQQIQPADGKLDNKQLTEMIHQNLQVDLLQQPYIYFWLLLISSLMLTFLILLFATNVILKKLSVSVDHVTHTAHELAKGNYHARAFEPSNTATTELSRSINGLAENLEEITLAREIEKERLKTLIDNMGSALIMIGREGDISVVNDSFLELFDKNHEDVRKHVFRELGVDASLEEFVDYVFMTETPYRKQLVITIDQQFKHMEVYGAPVIGKHGRWLGVVIVMHDITELKKLEQVRKDFVANVSHELRTPITSIKGFAETLIDGAYKDEGALLSFLDIMHKESNRLQMLVQDLLELSKIEKEGFQVDSVPTSLNKLVDSSVELAQVQLDEKKMTLQLNMDEDVTVLGDANRLMQVFVNLLVNAVTYSKPDKLIQINIGTTGKYGFVEIIDQGLGIEKAEIPRVFERFYRVDRARSRNSGGTGLGLAIVKHLVEAHDGKIVVKSEVGVGTRMKILIPLAN
ncbi:MAG: PAS domain S-box protein [Kurthia sp.]|nr:PAS domain S-box protein [Candidatus Kurthia equi]